MQIFLHEEVSIIEYGVARLSVRPPLMEKFKGTFWLLTLGHRVQLSLLQGR